jgi:hypothetical protein
MNIHVGDNEGEMYLLQIEEMVDFSKEELEDCMVSTNKICGNYDGLYGIVRNSIFWDKEKEKDFLERKPDFLGSGKFLDVDDGCRGER